MVDIRKETAKLLLESSKGLAQVVASSSFEFWQRKDFRLYVKFATLDQTEQDRMFNEFEVSVLGLFILQLDRAQGIAEPEFKKFLKTLQQEVIESFLTLFSDLGVEKQFVDQWRVLIDMRLKEYREDFQIALKESKKMKEFKGDDELRNTWARIETITIDCLTHIRRGKVEEGDPLWKLLRKWLITLDVQLHPITKMSEEKQ